MRIEGVDSRAEGCSREGYRELDKLAMAVNTWLGFPARALQGAIQLPLLRPMHLESSSHEPHTVLTLCSSGRACSLAWP